MFLLQMPCILSAVILVSLQLAMASMASMDTREDGQPVDMNEAQAKFKVIVETR